MGIVAAGGTGARFGGGVPKQFLDLAGRTVLERSIAALGTHPRIDGVVVVLPPAEVDGPRAAAARRLPGVIDVVAGGTTRAASVLAGVRAAGDARFVLVHDAARPFAGRTLVEAVLRATIERGAAVPALEIAETVKETDAAGRVVRTLERERLRRVQTPQGARTDWLREALEGALQRGDPVTDESAALERAGRDVHLIPGDPGNVKITVPADLDEARRRLAPADAGLRVGSGFDVHRFAEGRPLVLGGVGFPGEAGLAGHSDADVVLHAAMDALLGAAALGDIGEHFPPGDPRFAGAASSDLAARVVALLAERGFEPLNLDLTLLAERPRIRERVAEMRVSIGRAFSLEPERIGLKATTLESLGALGRGEGIACQAVALVRRR